MIINELFKVEFNIVTVSLITILDSTIAEYCHTKMQLIVVNIAMQKKMAFSQVEWTGSRQRTSSSC